MRRLVDTYAQPFDVTDSRVLHVDAEPAAVLAALERLDLARPAIEAIAALGVAGRIALAPALLAARAGRERVYGMVWRVEERPAERLDPRGFGAYAGPGYVKVVWDVRVQAGDETGTLLSSTTRFVATDDAARERLRAAWGLVGAVSAALSKRALAALKRHAEDRPLAPPAAELRLAA